MSIGCSAITSQRDDARQGARLSLHVAVGTAASHTLLQGAIHARYRQRMNQMLLDVVVAEGIAKHCHLQFGTQIVIERKSRAISQLIA